jgi:hypothetical protein
MTEQVNRSADGFGDGGDVFELTLDGIDVRIIARPSPAAVNRADGEALLEGREDEWLGSGMVGRGSVHEDQRRSLAAALVGDPGSVL